MAANTYRIEVEETIAKQGDKIVAVTYSYKERHADGVKNLVKKEIKREDYEKKPVILAKKTVPFEQAAKILKPLMMGDFVDNTDIKEAFSILDADKSGKIDTTELAAFMPDGKSDVLLKHIAKVDKDNDKAMNLNEFTDFINKGIGRDIAAGKL